MEEIATPTALSQETTLKSNSILTHSLLLFVKIKCIIHISHATHDGGFWIHGDKEDMKI